ncbi:MAG: hypothetical protein Q7R95_08645 [bacterium]|nr:hypothetical protein [bacterium]
MIPFELKLQNLTSQPQVLRYVAKLIGSKVKKENFDLIVGPFSDIPLATTVSLECNWPMIFVRDERKKYGMEKLIEGSYNLDQKVIVIDEQVIDTASTLQMLGRLEGSNLTITGLIVLFDRELGELNIIKRKGYKCEALITNTDIFMYLLELGIISQNQINHAKDYFRSKKLSSYF